MQSFVTSPEFLSISLAQGRVAPVENYFQQDGNPDAAISGRPYSSVFPLIFFSCGISFTILDQSSQDCSLVADKRPDPGSLNGYYRNTGILLSAGANPNITASISTLLDDDSPDASYEVVHITQVTPLMIAALHGDAKICKILLASGADETCTDSHGKSFIDYAKMSKDPSDILSLAANIPQVIPHTPTNIQFTLTTSETTSMEPVSYFGSLIWSYNACGVKEIACRRRNLALEGATNAFKLKHFLIRLRDNRDRLKVVRYQVPTSQSTVMSQKSRSHFSHIFSELVPGNSYSLTISSVWGFSGANEVDIESFQSPATAFLVMPAHSSMHSLPTSPITKPSLKSLDLKSSAPIIDALVYSPQTAQVTRPEATSPWENQIKSPVLAKGDSEIEQEPVAESEASNAKLMAWHAACNMVQETVNLIDIFAVASASLSVVCNGSSNFACEDQDDDVLSPSSLVVVDDDDNGGGGSDKRVSSSDDDDEEEEAATEQQEDDKETRSALPPPSSTYNDCIIS